MVNQISMVEAIAAPIALETFSGLIKGKRIVLLVDSEAVEGALIKGYSSKEDLCHATCVFWEIARREGTHVYVDRVPTDGNLADGTSRASWRSVGVGGWATVGARIPEGMR